MTFAGKLKALFDRKPAAKTHSGKAIAKAKTYAPPSDRAALIAEAMAVYRRESAAMQAGLDRALNDLRSQAPKVLRDPEALSRILALHQAHVRLRGLMASDRKRFLVLTGMRELLDDEERAGAPARGGGQGVSKAPAKSAAKVPPKRPPKA